MKLKEMGSRSNYCLDQKEINNVERGRNNILSFGKDHESVGGWEQLQAFLLLRQIFERDTTPLLDEKERRSPERAPLTRLASLQAPSQFPGDRDHKSPGDLHGITGTNRTVFCHYLQLPEEASSQIYLPWL